MFVGAASISFSVLFAVALQPPVAEPFESPAPTEEEPSSASGDTPFEPGPVRPPRRAEKPARRPVPLPDRKTAHMVRASLLFGPMWRIRDVDPVLAAGVEYGRMHGFSGAFQATFTPRERDRAEDVPSVTEASMALGPVLRGRLRTRPLYGSVGLTAGIRIHRATTAQGVLHRVDPDFTLPIQGAWTIRGIGLSLAFVQGYSVRERTYERRGQLVWRRSAYRVGFFFGLHWDVMVHRTAGDTRARTRRERQR